MLKFKEWVQKYDYVFIVLLSAVLSVSSFLYFYDQGLITAYGDSRAHLNISRRVIDNLTPGLAQLGGAWLPLLHVLTLTTIWNDFLWHSGISGSLINMPAYIIGMYALYKLVFEITGNRLNAFVAFAAVGTNINILYFQATPMGEMLFISTLIVSLYFIFKWARTGSFIHLIVAGFFFFLSSINRYEGWFVAVGAVILVLIASLIKFGRKKTEGNLILFSTIACSGIAIWLLWQWAIFGHPFDFLRSEFAAGVNTARDIEAGLVPTYKNLQNSILTEIYASFHTSGIILTVGGLLTILLFILIKNVHVLKSPKFILLLAIMPFFFEILVVYRGNVPVYVPEIRVSGKEIPDYFNVRYALYSLPALAIFLSIISKQIIVAILLLLFILVNNILLLPVLGNQKILALKDWGNLSSREHISAQVWFKENYDKGLILVSVASSDAYIFKTGLPMKTFISEGSGKYWRESLIAPRRHARWVIIQDSGRDVLIRRLNMKSLETHFDLKAKKGGYRFYEVKKDSELKRE